MPQCPDDSVFRGAVADAAYAALEKSVREFHGDRGRIYVTGLSMGGYGVWQEIVDHPGVFAAAVAVSAGLTPSADMDNLYVAVKGDDPYTYVAAQTKGLPIWIFTARRTTSCLPYKLASSCRQCVMPAPIVKYTEYPDVGHGAWEPAYAMRSCGSGCSRSGSRNRAADAIAADYRRASSSFLPTCRMSPILGVFPVMSAFATLNS